MATAGQERQSISLRVPIYCLLELLTNFLCLFHVIVIVVIELNLTLCAQCKILTYWDSRTEIKMGYTMVKKKQSCFQKLAEWKFFFHLLAHIYTYLISKNNKQMNKQKQESNKQKKLKKKKEYLWKIDLKKNKFAATRVKIFLVTCISRKKSIFVWPNLLR